MAFLSLMFPLTVFADIIDEPPPLSTDVTVVSLIAIIILVAVLAIATVLIIRRLKKSSKNNEPSRSGKKNGRGAHDTQNPSKP